MIWIDAIFGLNIDLALVLVVLATDHAFEGIAGHRIYRPLGTKIVNDIIVIFDRLIIAPISRACPIFYLMLVFILNVAAVEVWRIDPPLRLTFVLLKWLQFIQEPNPLPILRTAAILSTAIKCCTHYCFYQ